MSPFEKPQAGWPKFSHGHSFFSASAYEWQLWSDG